MRRAPAVVVGALAAALSSSSARAEPPSADEVTRVLSWFEGGKDDGPVLLEALPCLAIERPSGEPGKRCTTTVTGAVKQGTPVYAYMRFAVPKAERYDLVVEWVHEGAVRATSRFSVSTSWSYAAWKGQLLDKSGAWQARIKRDDKELGGFRVTVE